MRKKVICIVLLTVLITCTSLNVNAAVPDNNTIEPLWNNIYLISESFSFIGTEGSAEAVIYGQSGTTYIECTTTIYKQVGSGWSYVNSDTDYAYSSVLIASLDVTGSYNGYYKAVFDIKVTRNGTTETESTTAYASVSPNP